MLEKKVTLCLTIGRRPDLLRKTLESLAGMPPLPILAINDFGDADTNAVFEELCPQGRLIQPGRHLGHHAAIDEMYSHVNTPYIFHGEDDWDFSRTDFLTDALLLLQSEPRISVVCFRASDDMQLSDSDRALIVTEMRSGISFERLDALHKQWHGYTFNPHLAPKQLWQQLGGFTQFAKERHLSRFLRGKGQYAAFMLPEACRHIGEGRSTVAIPFARVKRLKNWLRGKKQVE